MLPSTRYGRPEFGQPHTRIRTVMDDGWEKIVTEDLVRCVEG